MALMAFGNTFGAQMKQFNNQLQRMTPAQIASSRSVGAFGVQKTPTGLPGASRLGFLAQPGGSHVSFLSGLSKIGSVFSAGSDILHSIGSVIHPAATAAGKAATTAIDAAGSATKAVAAAAKAHPVLAAAGVASAAAAGIGAAKMGGTSAAKLPKHIKAALGIPHHRRMHVTNTRALHRALRRVKGFERVAKRVLSITRPGHHKIHFKMHRRKRAA